MSIQIDPSHLIRFKVFDWPGLAWTPGIVGRQWLWAVIGLGLILLSTTWFARFDPSQEGLGHGRSKRKGSGEREPAQARNRAPHLVLPDLSPLVTKLRRARPDAILHTGYNPDITLFLRQSKEQGLKWDALIGHGAGYGQFNDPVGVCVDSNGYVYVTDFGNDRLTKFR